MEVKQITRADTKPWILDKHYARRMPSVSFAYGLFDNDDLVGIITYGSPASPSLCKGVCGEEFRSRVIELNRLVIERGIPSYLIGQSLKKLPKPKIVVSYADTAWTHVGYVYQASNWLFTGTTKPRTDMLAGDVAVLGEDDGLIGAREAGAIAGGAPLAGAPSIGPAASQTNFNAFDILLLSLPHMPFRNEYLQF